jgi:hypothetical protein
MPLRLTAPQWRQVVRWFVRGMPSAQIAHETGLDRKRTLRALIVLRRAMTELAPPALASVHRRQYAESLRVGPMVPDRSAMREPLPVLGIYVSHGEFWSVVVAENEAARIERAFRERGSERRELPRIGPYIAVVYRRRLYRLTKPNEERATSFGQVEAFWSYLQRQLRSKGGIRRSRLNLYLAEYTWRYNHRKWSADEQVRELMALVRRVRRGARNVAFPGVIDAPLSRASY